MAAEDKKRIDREKRGQFLAEEIEACIEFKTAHLIEMLNADNAQKRTIAAAILGNRKDKKGIVPLCDSLKKEKALYSRIAMSEALGKMGETAVPSLIKLLGQIGNNQETELPVKYFNKKSFPLARDMAARTIIKIGKPATPYLIKVVEEQDSYILQQAIDALGGIAAKTNDKSALRVLLNGLETRPNNKITFWKIIRALSGFKHSNEALPPLLNILESDCDAAIIWESARTLGQIGINRPDVISALCKLEENNHPEVKKAAKNALIILK
ncbi:HEAT repeat domain-containing protein [Methanobacterium sp.]|uniref:HEAT repeat domain-containing protein n=1 Tax=Methanobacterium sp. TaxID=2164 RepID=UPI003C75E7B5